MRFEAFIHNDDMMCFYVVIQGTQKMVVMGHHNFKDEALIKRWWASHKMNGTCKKFKDKNKQSNCRKLFLFVVKNYVCFQSFGVHKSMNAKSAIEKL
jgi:hypothetical protein